MSTMVREDHAEEISKRMERRERYQKITIDVLRHLRETKPIFDENDSRGKLNWVEEELRAQKSYEDASDAVEIIGMLGLKEDKLRKEMLLVMFDAQRRKLSPTEMLNKVDKGVGVWAKDGKLLNSAGEAWYSILSSHLADSEPMGAVMNVLLEDERDEPKNRKIYKELFNEERKPTTVFLTHAGEAVSVLLRPGQKDDSL